MSFTNIEKLTNVRNSTFYCAQSSLSSWTQNIIETSVRNRLRFNKSRGSKVGEDYELPPDFLHLAVAILRHTLGHEAAVDLSVTQLVQLDTTTQVGKGRNKKISGSPALQPRYCPGGASATKIL